MIKNKPEIRTKKALKQKDKSTTTVFLALSALALFLTLFTVVYAQPVAYVAEQKQEQPPQEEPASHKGEEEKKLKRTVVREITTKVTGYNTVPEQTDSTPCIASSGLNICGMKNVVACPRELKSGTIVEIHGKEYKCVDILAEKYDHRFDISCDKDFECPYKVTSNKTTVKIIKYSYE